MILTLYACSINQNSKLLSLLSWSDFSRKKCTWFILCSYIPIIGEFLEHLLSAEEHPKDLSVLSQILQLPHEGTLSIHILQMRKLRLGELHDISHRRRTQNWDLPGFVCPQNWCPWLWFISFQHEKCNPRLKAVCFLIQDGSWMALPETMTLITAITMACARSGLECVEGQAQALLPPSQAPPQPFPREKVEKLRAWSPEQSQDPHAPASFWRSTARGRYRGTHARSRQGPAAPAEGRPAGSPHLEAASHTDLLPHLQMCKLSKGLSRRKFQYLPSPNIFLQLYLLAGSHWANKVWGNSSGSLKNGGIINTLPNRLTWMRS